MNRETLLPFKWKAKGAIVSRYHKSSRIYRCNYLNYSYVRLIREPSMVMAFEFLFEWMNECELHISAATNSKISVNELQINSMSSHWFGREYYFCGNYTFFPEQNRNILIQLLLIRKTSFLNNSVKRDIFDFSGRAMDSLLMPYVQDMLTVTNMQVLVDEHSIFQLTKSKSYWHIQRILIASWWSVRTF